MRSIRTLLLCGLVCLPISLFAQPAPASSAKPGAAAASSASNTGADRLRREIDALRSLLDGRLPQDLPLPALFEVDLGDAAAVAQRAQALNERLATRAVVAQGDEMAMLRAARDGLRLSFLNLPAERRDALREQDRLKRQG